MVARRGPRGGPETAPAPGGARKPLPRPPGVRPKPVRGVPKFMSIGLSAEKSGSFVLSQYRYGPEPPCVTTPPVRGPAVTISHQAGAGVNEIAAQVAQRLEQTEFKGKHPWTVFDRQLIEQALVEHRWPKKLAQEMTEEKRPFLDELMDDLFNLRPPSWAFVPQVMETTLRLATAGHVILVGHGATVVTAQLPNVFHVRLIGSLPRRIKRVQKLRHLTADAAARFIRKEDRGRTKYVETHFHARLGNLLLYDLVLNTDRLSDGHAAALITEGARQFFSTRLATP